MYPIKSSYDKMYTVSAYNKHLKIHEFLSTLQAIVDNLMNAYLPRTLANIKLLIELVPSQSFRTRLSSSVPNTNCVFRMETLSLLDLLNAQYYLENWNLVLCTSHISSLKSRLSTWENTLQNKEV